MPHRKTTKPGQYPGWTPAAPLWKRTQRRVQQNTKFDATAPLTDGEYERYVIAMRVFIKKWAGW